MTGLFGIAPATHVALVTRRLRRQALTALAACTAVAQPAIGDDVTFLEAIGVPVAVGFDGTDAPTWAEMPRRLEEGIAAASSSTALLLDPRSTACRGSIACSAHRLARLSVNKPKSRRPPVSVVISAHWDDRKLKLRLLAFSTNRLLEMPHARDETLPESAWDEAEVFIAQSSVRAFTEPIAARIDRVEELRPTLVQLWAQLRARVEDIFVEEASRPSPVAALRLELPTVGVTIRIDDHPAHTVLSSQLEVTGLNPGVRRVEISHPDYLTLRRSVELAAGPNTLAVQLQPRPSVLGRVSGSSWITAGVMAGLGTGAAVLATTRVAGTTVLFPGGTARTLWPRLVADDRAGQGPLIVPTAIALGVGALTTILVDGLVDAEDRPAWLLPVAVVGSVLLTYGVGELVCWGAECRP